MSRQLLKSLPPFLREILEFQEICRGEQEEFDRAHSGVMELLHNQFAATAEEWGLSRLEKIAGIRPKAGASLAERRFALQARTMEQRPTTELFLRRKLAALCGENGYTLEVRHSEYLLRVRLALASKSNEGAVRELIGWVKPANMGADIDLLYNRYGSMAGKTHGALHSFNHGNLRSEVMKGV